MRSVLVTGGAGQLAQAIRLTWTRLDPVIPDEGELDLGDPEAVRSVIGRVRPEVVVNAGAFTSVDLCESEPARAFRINGEAVSWLADACNAAGALLVQVSTDYVFDGTSARPYRETDLPRPVSVYGRSKLAGEHAAAMARNHLIARTAWLYDAWGRNFLRTMLKTAADGKALRVVSDQRGGPTSCRSLARQLETAILEDWRGLVHCTCPGETSWYEFAREIFRLAGVQADLKPCTTAEYPLPAPRPAYSVLEGSRRAQLGTDLMPSWQQALADVLTHPVPVKESPR